MSTYKEREAIEIREILERYGWDPKGAELLQADGIGPIETEERAKHEPSFVGSLLSTHRIRKVSK